MLSYYQYSIILETFHFDSNNMFPFGFLFKKKVQTLHHLLPSGNNYSQKLPAVDDGKEIETYHILKHWKNMLACRSVWGFECFVSILCFKLFIHFSLQQTYQKMNHIFFVSSMFCCCQLCASWGSRSWCCTKSRSCTRCCMYQTNDGAVPHMMFLDQIMVLDLINMWNFTLDTITFLTAF